jgi:hypothetical protein
LKAVSESRIAAVFACFPAAFLATRLPFWREKRQSSALHDGARLGAKSVCRAAVDVDVVEGQAGTKTTFTGRRLLRCPSNTTKTSR